MTIHHSTIIRDKTDAKTIEYFLSSSNHKLIDISNRMHKCLSTRRERKNLQLADGKVVSSFPGFQCKNVACSACRSHIIRKSQLMAHDRFAEMQNYSCSHVTIVLNPCSSLEEADQIITKVRRSIRDLRDKKSQSYPKLRNIEIFGFVEFDLISPFDVQNLLPERKSLISHINVNGDCDRIWIPHLHMNVHHPLFSSEKLESIFCNRWDAPHQVHVRPFEQHHTAGYTAAVIAGYGLKFNFSSDIGGINVEWSDDARCEFLGWLSSKKRGLEPLRIAIGSMDDISIPVLKEQII